MPRAGFEPAIPATKLPHAYALDREVTAIGHNASTFYNKFISVFGFPVFEPIDFQSLYIHHTEQL
jgi:hypothetical protein